MYTMQLWHSTYLSHHTLICHLLISRVQSHHNQSPHLLSWPQCTSDQPSCIPPPFVCLWPWLQTSILLAQSFCRTIGLRTHAVQYINPVNWHSWLFAPHTATVHLAVSPTSFPLTFLDSRIYQLVTRILGTLFSTCRSRFCSCMTSSQHAMASGRWASGVGNYLYYVECSGVHAVSWDERFTHIRVIFLNHSGINSPSHQHTKKQWSSPFPFSTFNHFSIETLYFPDTAWLWLWL